MYEEHWKLSRRPFQNDNDRDFFFRSETHHAALLKMRYVVENRLGAALLAGGFGYGKSCIVSHLFAELPEHCRPIVHLRYPLLTDTELLGYIAGDIVDQGCETEGRRTKDETVRAVETALKTHTAEGRHPVIVVDEAHLIEQYEVLQSLQLLLNFFAPPTSEFSLFLVGDRPLIDQVSRFPALDDRMAVKSLLQPLSLQETVEYVEHRLAVAGRSEPIFTATGMTAMFERTGGVPRRINRIAELALVVGYAERMLSISAQEVEAVADELTVVVPD